MTRYAHQNGFHVDRRFGWDCHGLPVEYEIDKTIGIKSPEDMLKMGVGAYNAECRKIIMRYSREWEVRRSLGGVCTLMFFLTNERELASMAHWLDPC